MFGPFPPPFGTAKGTGNLSSVSPRICEGQVIGLVCLTFLQHPNQDALDFPEIMPDVPDSRAEVSDMGRVTGVNRLQEFERTIDPAVRVVIPVTLSVTIRCGKQEWLNRRF